MKAIAFLGGGRITGALAAGLRLAGYKLPIVVYDHHVYDQHGNNRHPAKLHALRRESRVEIARDLASAVARADLLIVAVRPTSVRGMLAEVAACGAPPPKLCISLAAGIPLRSLGTWMGPPVRWARAMPSPVCRIGRGLTPVCFERSVSRDQRAQVRRFFALVGPVLDLPETQFDAITATHSPTHGYHAVKTLAQVAESAGLDRKTALIAAAHALGDGIYYWQQSGESLDQLLHEAATPGGIAAATMAAMDKSGYAHVIAKGLRAGIAQARRNAR
jgi:pyrroline-5-carboxylate reductase